MWLGREELKEQKKKRKKTTVFHIFFHHFASQIRGTDPTDQANFRLCRWLTRSFVCSLHSVCGPGVGVPAYKGEESFCKTEDA